jgi:D-glycero-D-manno-heptose 1,7-bisphosphate phosphatase
MQQRALFLDRDGTINVDYGYVYQRENFHFIDGIFELVAAAKSLGYLVIIVTNQSGIGRGYYTEADFKSLMGWVQDQFACHGGCIDAIYFCPDHPEFGRGSYKRDTWMRKPGPGMLLEAAQAMKINLSQSVLVGDSLTDLTAGKSAGVGRLCYLGCPDGVLSPDVEQVNRLTDVIHLL